MLRRLTGRAFPAAESRPADVYAAADQSDADNSNKDCSRKPERWYPEYHGRPPAFVSVTKAARAMRVT